MSWQKKLRCSGPPTAARTSAACACICSVESSAQGSEPSPPAFKAAMARSGPAAPAMGAAMTGKRTPIRRAKASRRAVILPLACVGHRRPRLGGLEMAVLQQLDRNVVGRANEGHVAVARRAVDRDATVHQALA